VVGCDRRGEGAHEAARVRHVSRRRGGVAARGAGAAKEAPDHWIAWGATSSAQAQWTAAFVQRLRELGWVEGQTISIEYRWAEGRFEHSPAIIAEFVRLKVDIIVTNSTPNVLAAKQVTSAIPVVFPSAGDPVGNGLVTSLARPGGNITGLSVQSSELAQKLVQLLREFLPTLRRLATLYHVGPVAALQTDAVKAAASKLGLDIAVVEIRSAEEIAPAIEALKDRTDALIVPSEPLYNTNRNQINSLALRARLPTIYFDRLYVETGGLMSYGPHWPSRWRRAASYVDRIFKGEKPADLPVQAPTKYELVVNLKTAKALGLTVPATLLARADEVIE
jgi:ABC-type uncharacterized transport system substrate-binding protein